MSKSRTTTSLSNRIPSTNLVQYAVFTRNHVKHETMGVYVRCCMM